MTLRFPTQPRLGQIYQLDQHLDLECGGPGRPLGPARGVLTVPSKAILGLTADVDFFRHPEFIKQIPGDVFQYLRIRFTAMDENELKLCDQALKCARHFKRLHAVDLDKSDTSDAGVSELAGLSALTAVCDQFHSQRRVPQE